MINLKYSRIAVEKILTGEISGEYPWLDFKELYKNDPENLVHDILCLSNARHRGERYLIYGVENGSWKLKGISENLIANDIYDIVNKQIWNQKPVVAVDHVQISGKAFGFIAIADTATKPHYLRKPYRGIPAGAIYTRQGDTNTPFKKGTDAKSVEDGEIEMMFRERFGIDKPLLERIETLLTQSEKWNDFTDGELSGYYHSDFPEYQIRFQDSEIKYEEFWEPWVELHHKQTDLVQNDVEYSRIQRNSNMFGGKKLFSIYIHSTPIYQKGALIKIYETYCPYPSLKDINGRYRIRTDICEFCESRINYYVGALICLKDRVWRHHALEGEMVGAKIFRIYNIVMKSHIQTALADGNKEAMLVLDVDVVQQEAGEDN